MFFLQTRLARALMLLYLLGVLLQATYVPFQARQSASIFSAGMDAGYSWVWDRPVYFDSEKSTNISLAEAQEHKAKNPPSANPLSKYLFGETEVPASWIPIYGIDYFRLLLTLGVWTILTGGLFLLLKKNEG